MRRGQREELRYQFRPIGDALYRDLAVMRDSSAAISRLVTELRRMTARESGYATPELVRERLKRLRIELWASAVPKAIQG